jgi:hypothetical protein
MGVPARVLIASVAGAADVGPGCPPLGALLAGALPIGGGFAGEVFAEVLPPQPAITTAAEPATLAISTLAGTPMAG